MGLLDRLLFRKPSKEAFVKLVLEALQKGGASGVRYSAADFSVRVDSADKTFFLENAFTDYSHAEKTTDREASLQRYVSSFLEATPTPTDFDSARANLMPVVRDPAYFSLTTLKVRAEGKDASKLVYTTKPVAPGLVAGLAYDSERAIMTVNQSTLQEWGASLDDALDIAIQNLRDRTPAN